MPSARKVSLGDTFGQLTIIGTAPSRNKQRAFLVRCSCGTEKIATIGNLVSGRTTTCSQGRPKHGHWRSPTYISWAKMTDRCLGRNTDKDYQRRGITIDPNWRQFENFLADMNERPAGTTLERIDNNGAYTKANCRWATPAEQQRNTRRTRFVVIDGERMCLRDAARLIEVNYTTISSHARRHAKTLEEAIEFYRHQAGVPSASQ